MTNIGKEEQIRTKTSFRHPSKAEARRSDPRGPLFVDCPMVARPCLSSISELRWRPTSLAHAMAYRIPKDDRINAALAQSASTAASALADDASGFTDTATPLGDAQPFEYTPDAVSGEAEELAASTNNPKFAAKMLGYDQNTFSDILHNFKPDNGLGPADNVIWHDNGDVYFNGNFVANFHDWAN
ncbi:hypothetical protein P0D88_05025 [Paraburkholderia sp. RL18-103-BIB-C]|uniref:hypothetical protein n=1 Tax=unclassified Paraburkholderia TaxID=2615204 RepID=UPI0038B941BC